MSDDAERGPRTVRRGIGSATWNTCPECDNPMESRGHPDDGDGEVFECPTGACDLDGEVWVRPAGV